MCLLGPHHAFQETDLVLLLINLLGQLRLRGDVLDQAKQRCVLPGGGVDRDIDVDRIRVGELALHRFQLKKRAGAVGDLLKDRFQPEGFREEQRQRLPRHFPLPGGKFAEKFIAR